MVSFNEDKIISKGKNENALWKINLGREIKNVLESLSLLLDFRQRHLLAYSLRGHVLIFFSAELPVILHSLVPTCYFLQLSPAHQKTLLLELHEKIKLYSKSEE